MEKAITFLLLVVGIINFLPVLGVFSAATLSQSYSIELIGSDIAILMRHRALLFGILGGFILYAAFVPAWQIPAMVMAAASMLGYLVLLWLEGGYNASLRNVMWVDIVGVICLCGAVVLKVLVHANID